MTARDDKMFSRPPGTDRPASESAGRAPARRRLLLRGATAAVPTILTLHSGSAMAARSSFLISRAVGTPEGADGSYLCLDVSNATELEDGLYDLGDEGLYDVTKIDGSASYYKDPDGSQRASVADLCESGEFHYKRGGLGGGGSVEAPGTGAVTPGHSSLVRQSKAVDAAQAAVAPDASGLEQVRVQGRGMLVSATALSSFANRVIVREI